MKGSDYLPNSSSPMDHSEHVFMEMAEKGRRVLTLFKGQEGVEGMWGFLNLSNS